MRIVKINIVLSLCLLSITPVSAQKFKQLFRELILRIDTNEYKLSTDLVDYMGKPHLPFYFDDPEGVCEIELYPVKNVFPDSLELLPSGDFDLVDSIRNVNNEFYRFKLQFLDLINSDFLRLSFRVPDTIPGKSRIYEINLLPHTNSYVKFYPVSDELFIGEEKVFELICNNIENIKYKNDWSEVDGIQYRISKTFNQLQIRLLPQKLGRRTIQANLQTKKPFINEDGRISHQLPTIEHEFLVKESRLQFLNFDRNEVSLNDSVRLGGIEIQLDDSRLLNMQKTYRIENQEEPGGSLIAEIFTKNNLTNNQVLCLLRVYNYHRRSDGYLYIKDGDRAIFITNLDITQTTRIDKINILRDGNWTQDLSIHPGEVIDLKIDGVGLHKASFAIEELDDITTDTLIRGETMALFKFRVPMDVAKRRLYLYNHSRQTGHFLSVKEYQTPRPLDFVWIDYMGQKKKISDLPSTILTDGTIQNLIFGNNPEMIDSKDKLYGKQYLKIEITITGRKNELIEVKTIDNIVVCPGINSPRSEFYNSSDCGISDMDLNKYFRKKTSSLEIWSQINIRVSHQKEKYGGEGYSKEFDIILRKDASFDIEVSFPAGLITVSKPEEGSTEKFGSLTGISIAMIAQFTFYHPEKINAPRPYKIGAGFLAINAFDFSGNDDTRDVGLVIIGSLYPTTRDVKLTFPLYFGGGYLMKKGKPFFLIGPGIRIRL